MPYLFIRDLFAKPGECSFPRFYMGGHRVDERAVNIKNHRSYHCRLQMPLAMCSLVRRDLRPLFFRYGSNIQSEKNKNKNPKAITTLSTMLLVITCAMR